jgi:regulator of replication initiation timing
MESPADNTETNSKEVDAQEFRTPRDHLETAYKEFFQACQQMNYWGQLHIVSDCLIKMNQTYQTTKNRVMKGREDPPAKESSTL